MKGERRRARLARILAILMAAMFLGTILLGFMASVPATQA